ncbi:MULTISPECIES: hypothetical protein [unclassified Cupriavidus]|uniref:hypothetical protein n=1 Tax=unclassified Cupriavidus TaxID=2640874 RepID=UPI00313AB4C5
MTNTLLTRNECLGVAQPEVVQLMAWIDLHDRPALTQFDPQTGELVVYSIEIKAGKPVEVSERIAATLQAARAVLGY